MPIYELTKDALREIPHTSFKKENVYERNGLQKLLRDQIEVVADDVLVISEEFGEWGGDAKRSIDLLGVDKQGNVVVFELKRTKDGSHMELQAIRYAAMVSTLTFSQAVDAFTKFLETNQPDTDARATLLEFLDWSEPDEDNFAGSVRIVLVSQGFSKEITTSALWLNSCGIDIRCIELKPYISTEALLVHVQQIIPPPTAHQYQIRVAEKRIARRVEEAKHSQVLGDFWSGLLEHENKRRGDQRDTPGAPQSWLSHGAGKSGLTYRFTVSADRAGVELQIDTPDRDANNKIFDAIAEKTTDIEKAFKHELLWEKHENLKLSRVRHNIELGGYKTRENKRKELLELLSARMGELEKAINPVLNEL